MDVSSLSSAAVAALSNAGTDPAIGTAVLKKALDIQAQSAVALINALPPVPGSPNLPPHLGQNINTTA